MKILFVHKEEDPIDPMQIELLSALAKREGHETFLNILQQRDFSDHLRKLRPDIVAYTGKTGEHKILYEANRYVKETYGDAIFTIMGGPHCTFNHGAIQLYGESDDEFKAYRKNLPDGRFQRQVRPENSALDALCVGEGDDAWVELLRAFSKKQSIDDIANIVTRTNRRKYAEPVLHPRRTFLDDLPFFDRELVYDKTFLAHFPMRSFMVSRGCPFRCTYCFNYDWNQMYHRAGKLTKIHNRYSVDRLIAEIQHWREMETRRGYAKTQFIKFYDDMFEFRASPWLEEFAEKYPKEVGIPFSCLIRCDIFAHERTDGTIELREEVLRLLKKAGMRSINMSIEAGNDFIRENIFVRDMTRKEIIAAFDLMKRNGIGTFSNTILGIPAPVVPKPGGPDCAAKLQRAVHETKLAFTVAKKEVAGVRGITYPEELDTLMKNLAGDPTTLRRNLLRGIEILKGMGLRQDPIDYDIEAVELTLRCGCHQTLFPRLDPYPGTVITEYTIATGAFDGDFEKLHTSCLTTSAFRCYTPRQRRIQDNLSFLGQVCALWPWLWPVTKKYLIYLPFTRLYWLAFVLVKAHMVNRHVYPMKFTFMNWLKTAYHILLFETKQFFKGHRGEDFYKTAQNRIRCDVSDRTLGGRSRMP